MAREEGERKETVVRIDLSVRSALVALGTIATAGLLTVLWPILLVIVVALMFVGMLNPLVEMLQRRGLRRSTAIAVVFLAIAVFASGFATITIPRLLSQASGLFEHFPHAQRKLAAQLESTEVAQPFAASVRAVSPDAVIEKIKDYGLAYGPHALEIFAYGVSAFFLALYLILDRDRMRGALFSVFPRAYHVRLSRVLINLETIVGGYMRGQAITSALMVVFTFVVLTIFRVPNALVLALFAGLADVLPYVGALLACGPAFLAALDRGPTVAFAVLVILGVYQEFESRVIVPRVYGRVLRLPAATVMVALLVGGKLLGVLGALLALPIAAAIRMTIMELRVELPGEELVDDALLAKDAEAEAEFEARAAGLPACEAATIATEIAAAREGEEETAEDGDPAPITSGVPSAS